MVRGLYTSAWSMLACSKKMDVIANNLANVNTNGYKKDSVILQSFPDLLTKRIYDYASRTEPGNDIGNMSMGDDVGEVFTYYKQGQIVNTDNNLDMAIKDSDSAFFTVEVPSGSSGTREMYTRDGSFTVNSDGTLVTKDGYKALGEDGPIVLRGESFAVGSDGTISQDDVKVAKLRITQFSDTAVLRKYGNNLVEAPANAEKTAFNGAIKQDFLEGSNVNTIKEMVDMISVMRAYEANSKVIKAYDDTIGKAVNEVGSLR